MWSHVLQYRTLTDNVTNNLIRGTLAVLFKVHISFDYIFFNFPSSYNEEQIIQEIAIDGTVIQVRSGSNGVSSFT